MTAPLLSRARLCPSLEPPHPPADIAVTPASSVTSTGTSIAGLVVPPPSCPRLFLPQAMTRPFLSRAKLKNSPAETATTSRSPGTSTGTSLPDVVPLPSCPYWLPPQAITLPVVSRARLWPSGKGPQPPAETAATPVSPRTSTGVSLLDVVPSPSCPSLLAPQAITVPAPSSARLWNSPAEMAVTPLSPGTSTGTSLLAVVPSPSSPYPL